MHRLLVRSSGFWRLCVGSLLAFVLAGSHASASLVTIYSDLGPGNSFNTNGGGGINGSSETNGVEQTAASFTPAFTALLAQIDLPVLAFFNIECHCSSAVSLSLEADQSGVPSGTAMETWDFDAPPVFPTSGVLETFLSTGTVSLSAGQTYWLVMAPTDPTTIVIWNGASSASEPGTTTLVALDSSPFSTTTTGTTFSGSAMAFDVLGTPEPAGWLLLASGLAILFGMRASESGIRLTRSRD